MAYILALSGLGDGSSSGVVHFKDRLFFYSPSIALLFFIAASLRFIPVWLARSILVIAELTLLFFAGVCLFRVHKGWIFTFPFILFGTAAYYFLWPQKKKTPLPVT
jgi:hypothetical protein